MHRFPPRTAFYIGGVECLNQSVTGAPELLLIDQEAAQPVDVKPVAGLGHERDAGEISKGFAVAEGDGAALLDPEVKDFELAPPDPGQHVAHAGIVTHFREIGP